MNKQSISPKSRTIPREREVLSAGFDWKHSLKLLEPAIPRTLIPSEKMVEVREFAASLPGLWHWGMFETRLHAHDAQVDLLGCLLQGRSTRRSLLSALNESCFDGFSRTASTLRKWASDDGGPVSRTPNMWMEWDRDGSNLPPLAWLCIAPHFFDPQLSILSPHEIGQLAQEFMESDPQLHVEGATATLVELASALPPGGQLMGFASLRPRGRNTCRVFACLPRGMTRKWLEAIGWPGDGGQLSSVEKIFRVEGEPEWCQIEFGQRVAPHLALEIAQTASGFPHKQARRRWLDQAVAQGWACPAKASDVMDWHGKDACVLPSGEPVDLLRSFHLKLTLSSERAPVAKAYLGFYCRRKVASR